MHFSDIWAHTIMGLFGKSAPPDPREQVKEWSKKLRKERNALDRQVNQIKREEQKAVASIKQAAKKNDTTSAKILAREVVNARKAVTRITTAKAQINSVEMQMQQQASQIRVVGALQKSTDVMKSMSNLIKERWATFEFDGLLEVMCAIIYTRHVLPAMQRQKYLVQVNVKFNHQ